VAVVVADVAVAADEPGADVTTDGPGTGVVLAFVAPDPQAPNTNAMAATAVEPIIGNRCKPRPGQSMATPVETHASFKLYGSAA
jgi:hypothetical protein